MATNPQQLQEHAQQAEKHLEALATGLAESGAPENVTKTVSQMADVARKVVSALSDARGAAPSEAAPEDGDVPPEAQEAPPEEPASIGGAAQELQAEVAAKAAARRNQ